MNAATYAVIAVIAILFALALRHIFKVTLGGRGCCGGDCSKSCPHCRQDRMKLHGGIKRD